MNQNLTCCCVFCVKFEQVKFVSAHWFKILFTPNTVIRVFMKLTSNIWLALMMNVGRLWINQFLDTTGHVPLLVWVPLQLACYCLLCYFHCTDQAERLSSCLRCWDMQLLLWRRNGSSQQYRVAVGIWIGHHSWGDSEIMEDTWSDVGMLAWFYDEELGCWLWWMMKNYDDIDDDDDDDDYEWFRSTFWQLQMMMLESNPNMLFVFCQLDFVELDDGGGWISTNMGQTKDHYPPTNLPGGKMGKRLLLLDVVRVSSSCCCCCCWRWWRWSVNLYCCSCFHMSLYSLTGCKNKTKYKLCRLDYPLVHLWWED